MAFMLAVRSGWTRTVAPGEPPGSGRPAGRGVGCSMGGTVLVGSAAVLDVLRPGILDGVSACVAGGGRAVVARLGALGASVAALDADLGDEGAVAAAVGALGRI